MTTIREDPHAVALIAVLGTVTIAGVPLKVGDAVAPKSGDGKVVAPCAVLYGREGGSLTGSLGCVDTDGEIPFQVTAVGRTASEARTVADKCRLAVTSTELVVPGRWVANIRPRSGGSRVERDDDLAPPLFYAVTQYRMLTLQAS